MPLKRLRNHLKKLHCTSFIGDGDSNCFAFVQKGLENAPTHSSYDIEKEECVEHTQKRIGIALCNFQNKAKGITLSNGKEVQGHRQLTDDLINKVLMFSE